MPNPFTTGPIAPQNNPPIHPDWFAPKVFQISEITRGMTTLITTTVDHDYVIGQLIRTIIPMFYGMRELDEVQGYVIGIPDSDQVVIDVDSRAFNAFIPNPAFHIQLPYILAIGDINTGYISSTGRNIPFVGVPGSFINISPGIGIQ